MTGVGLVVETQIGLGSRPAYRLQKKAPQLTASSHWTRERTALLWKAGAKSAEILASEPLFDFPWNWSGPMRSAYDWWA